MKAVAVLLDGGYVRYELYRLLKKQHATAAEIVGFARACVTHDEELFRIYYYDCPPYGEAKINPLSHNVIDFSKTTSFLRAQTLHQQLRIAEGVAFRSGHLMFNGWGVSRSSTRELLKAPRQLVESDLEPQLRQKRVDMMIGLDIAWLASKGIVQRLVLVTGDTDFVPAMKFARREGVQVVIASIPGASLRYELQEHADQIRCVAYP